MIASLIDQNMCIASYMSPPGTTIWSTKLSHHSFVLPCTCSALVHPALTQNLCGVAGLLFYRFTALVLNTSIESILIMFNRFSHSQPEDLTTSNASVMHAIRLERS